MKQFKLNDRLLINNEDKEIKDLTLEDLYKLYQRQRMISLVKIINGDLSLFLEKEEDNE